MGKLLDNVQVAIAVFAQQWHQIKQNPFLQGRNKALCRYRSGHYYERVLLYYVILGDSHWKMLPIQQLKMEQDS